MTDRIRPRSFAQAARRKHTRHGKHYDPETARQGPWLAIGMGFAALFLLLAGGFAVWKFNEKSTRDEEERMRPVRSRQLLEDMRQYRMANSGDDKIEAVRLFVNDRIPKLMDMDQSEARQLLNAIDEQKKQMEFRQRIDRLIVDVRTMSKDPAMAISMRDKAAQLEKLLLDLDDERARDVKNEIFVARGTSAIEAARQMVKHADEMAEKGERDYVKIVEAYEKADHELADVLVAQKFPAAKEIHDEIAGKVSNIAETWAESAGGFNSVTARDLLQAREFQPTAGETKPAWQTSPGAKFELVGDKLVIDGVKPEKTQGQVERAGIAFWSPSPTTSIRHYEVKFTVKIVKTGFSLLARQGTGYMRNLYEFEVLAPGANGGDAFFPKEGNSYAITQRVYGKKVKTEALPQDAEESVPTVIDTTTSAREGGIGFLMKYGSKIEVTNLSVKILR